MAEYLLFPTSYAGCEENCDNLLDLRDDRAVIEEYVLEKVNEVLDRSDDTGSTDEEKEGLEYLVNQLVADEIEKAKRFIAKTVTGYFRGDDYMDRNAEGIRVTVLKSRM